jgi:two-component system sensor histidine kinase KdpD
MAGRLKVIVGMAAGVGKTYAMLEEGHELRAGGRDVVIGWLETHGRVETAAVASGIEVVPALEIEYRGVPLREMDTAAILARGPEIALIDELAHTNVPGTGRVKRVDDVTAVLEDGIDVVSTMNVQHLESLNDQVYELTGVRVRETVPDRVLLDADEVVLVDLTPEALQARLRAGRVYPSDRIDAALANFFTTANLSVLREIALREVAGAVDERIQRDAVPVRRESALSQGAPLAERVMVLVWPRRGAQRVVRRGWRAARRLGAELDVACPEARLDDEGRRQRDLVRDLCTTLGAHHWALQGEDLVLEVESLVRDRGVTRLVMPAPRPRGALSRLRGDLLTRLLERLEGVDIFLIAERDEIRPGDG